MQIDSASLEQAEQEHRATLNEENRRVRDDVIYPFAQAMKIEGYVEMPRASGCSELRQCPTCKGAYSTRYTKAGVIFWGCPHCKNITES